MRMRGTFRFAGQGEPMQRPSLPVPVNGGSPSLWRIHVAVSSSSPTGGGDGLPWVAKPELVLLLTDLLAIALASKRLFHALLFTRFQIKRVTLDFLDNVFRLHLALEASQCVLKGFAFLYSNLCQENTPPNIPNRDSLQNTPVWQRSCVKSLVIFSCDAVKTDDGRAQ